MDYMEYFGSVFEYQTDKAYIVEFVIGSRSGIISLKLNKSQNGRIIRVFTGFDVPTWGHELDSPTPDADFWEHRYFTAGRKAIAKWKGVVDEFGLMKPNSHLMQEIQSFVEDDEYEAICGAIDQDPKVCLHFAMLTGLVHAESSNAKATNKTVATKAKIKTINQIRMETDEQWGIF